MFIDECDQQTECTCSRKFRNDDHHQYILSNSHRLMGKQRLDLIPLMQNNLNDTRHSFSSHENLRISTSSSSIMTDDMNNSSEHFRRKKSASLNSPANSGKMSFHDGS